MTLGDITKSDLSYKVGFLTVIRSRNGYSCGFSCFDILYMEMSNEDYVNLFGNLKGVENVNVNFKKTIGKIKPMHAVNNVPLIGATDNLFHYVGEAGIPFSRLHDTGGAYGGGRFVDIANIFRNFDADENDPASYDFAFTDWLLNAIDAQKTKVFYRLGATIENQQNIKAYYIYPPKDNMKWAKICEKIIAHYNEGWANGYRLGIEYWEIWNEPDNYPNIRDNCMWKGTFEQYLELYKVTAPYLKERFPYIKIGGYASCGFYNLFENNVAKIANSSSRTEYFIECFEKFMKFVQENKLPLDFFSWHSYSDVEKNIAYENYVHSTLQKYGFLNTESILNEWNPGISKRGTLEDSCNVLDMMLQMQYTTVDMLMYYDGQVHGSYQGLYNPVTFEPFKTYYVFKAFSVLYKLGNQVEIIDDFDGISCVAAIGKDKKAILMTNKNTEKKKIQLVMDTEESLYMYRLNCNLNLEVDGEIRSEDFLEIGQFETFLLSSQIL